MSEEIARAEKDVEILIRWAERAERAEKELAAMRRTASSLADENGHIAIELLQAQLELEALREYRAYWEPYIKQLGDEHTRQGGDLAAAETERDYWRVQAQDTLTELHAVEAARNATEAELRSALDVALTELDQWRADKQRALERKSE